MAFSSNDPRNYAAVAKQTVQGTEATSGFKFVKFLNDSILAVDVDHESVYEGGDGQDHGLHYRKTVKPDGSVECFARPDTFAYLGAWAMGSGVTPASVADTAVASHIYTPNATIPYLTVEQAWGGGNQIDRVSDAMLRGFQVEGVHGEPWKLTAPIVGGGTPYYRDGAASALTAVLESGDPAMYAGGAYLIDAATSIDIRQFNFNFERNIDDDLYTIAPFRREVVALTRSLELTMQVIYQNATLYKQVQYGGGSVVPFSLATGSFHAERALTASQLIAIDVPNVRYTGVGVNRLEPDGQTVILDVSAMGVKAGTGICQLRANITGRATSYLLP